MSFEWAREADLCAAWGYYYDAERVAATQNAENRVLVAAWEYARACQVDDGLVSALSADRLLKLCRALVDE